jgi:hypothetical protein
MHYFYDSRALFWVEPFVCSQQRLNVAMAKLSRPFTDTDYTVHRPVSDNYRTASDGSLRDH